MKHGITHSLISTAAAVLLVFVLLTGCSIPSIDVLMNAIANSTKTIHYVDKKSPGESDEVGSDFSIDPDGEGDTDFSQSLEDGILKLVNAERQSLSLAALIEDPELKKTARERSEELMESDHFEHTRPDGREWVTIMEEHDYHYTVISENLQKGKAPTLTAQEIFQSWKESEPHYKAIIASDVTRTGIGIYVRKSQKGYEWYATEHFSAPR